ncbi:hypothetical protein [Moraxella nasicaprae]|uniref:Preprotein translocase subunit SecA n=1 Tax=Moraxella nasicaprae TaxID=2904122 RepID=A0ABY6F6A7_9GAMM|nr:hypothetical protein [Moraxella nasicaprae]UXZ05634.1 hypothetical protein LU297_04115 [Moraxella nasicaprae]
MNKERQTPTLEDLDVPKNHELPEDVIPFYGNTHSEQNASALKLAYDILTLCLLVVDLILIATDSILMSAFMQYISTWLGFGVFLENYATNHHTIIATIGGFFTLFWITDLLVRWLLAIIKRTYYRWFFFPFVHWYEVLGCFPVLRALRLLRAAVIIRRLHRMGIQIIPTRWLNSAKFYYHVILEELSDRVILTAIDNLREQLGRSGSHGQMIHRTISQNRQAIESAILSLLRNELTPRLQAALLADEGEKLAQDIGKAVENALSETPELRRYLKLIPIAGGMIESQITNVGKHIGTSVTQAINAHLFHDETLDGLMTSIAHGVANIDTSRPEVQHLVSEVVEDAISTFEEQVKNQQWKHSQQLPL